MIKIYILITSCKIFKRDDLFSKFCCNLHPNPTINTKHLQTRKLCHPYHNFAQPNSASPHPNVRYRNPLSVAHATLVYAYNITIVPLGTSQMAPLASDPHFSCKVIAMYLPTHVRVIRGRLNFREISINGLSKKL